MSMTRRFERLSLIIVVALLTSFAIMSWTAIVTKSATADEPLHALAAYMRTFHADFRLNPDHPPLWGYWAMIPQRATSLRVDTDSPDWKILPSYMWSGAKWTTQTLYRTPGNDPDAFINRSRAMMLALGVALGALIAVWAWELGGPMCAVVATTLYAFDPNFLAHAPIVKDDVPIALVMFALAYATWRAGQRLTLANALAIGLLLAAAVNVKFSGLLLIPMLALLLFVRALMPRPWIVFWRLVATTLGKLAVASSVLVVAGVTSVGAIWATHAFRFLPTPDTKLELNLGLIARAGTWSELVARDPDHRVPAESDVDAAPRPIIARAALFAEQYRLLPQAWLAGLLETYNTTRLWPCYVMGTYSRTGWWSYYPLTILFKTPLATLVAGALAIILMLARRKRGPSGSGAGHIDKWALVCLLTPIALYAIFAITSRLDQGIRHILPLFPFAFVLIAASLLRVRRVRGLLLFVLAIGLMVESILAYPDYIPFFNAVFRAHRIVLLGDSNLDWGQDLKSLASWQDAHPGDKLYLSYFGMADPGYYVKYVALPGNSGSLLEPQVPRERGVIAISATNLQGIYLDERTRAWYRQLPRGKRPIDVLGGSICLFEFDGPPRAEGEQR